MRRFLWAGMILLCGLGGLAYLGFELTTPFARFRQETFVDFPKGTSSRQMAVMLQNSGVIRNAWTFEAVRLFQRRARLQAGEYRFAKPASVVAVFERIARGDIFYYELVVPEGNNMFDVAASAQRLGLFTAQEFLTAARNPALIRDLDPQAPSLEGFLFPDTYRLSRHTTPERLCQIMTARFRAVWQGLETDQPVHRTVTLASLVEKEGKTPDERPVIASVFINRLAIGMKLDCDPTTIYAALLDGSYRGVIYKSDLASGNPYNTYRHAGLPPGPIANPGAASIAAVLHPAGTGYFYFVARADGSGRHSFASNLSAQEANIVRYRTLVRRH